MNLFRKLFGKESHQDFMSRIKNELAEAEKQVKNMEEEINEIEQDIDVNQLKLEKTEEKTTESQNKRILKHLKAGHTITALEALELFQCFRLSARISDLRSYGFRINTTMIRTNTGKRVAEYKLDK
jgi:predicted  nucleic acid-binding Zn-ribbon protein